MKKIVLTSLMMVCLPFLAVAQSVAGVAYLGLQIGGASRGEGM